MVVVWESGLTYILTIDAIVEFKMGAPVLYWFKNESSLLINPIGLCLSYATQSKHHCWSVSITVVIISVFIINGQVWPCLTTNFLVETTSKVGGSVHILTNQTHAIIKGYPIGKTRTYFSGCVITVLSIRSMTKHTIIV